jgi:hypothetical protein
VRSIGHLRTHRSRTFIAGIAVASVLAFGMGVVPAGASKQLSASESSFCKTLLSFKAKEPTGTSYTAYQKWAKTYLPFWEKLASEAPSSGSKAVLNELVSIVKYEATSKSLKALGLYAASHEVQWANGWKSFAKDVEACAVAQY